jgi:hypothetical protein
MKNIRYILEFNFYRGNKIEHTITLKEQTQIGLFEYFQLYRGILGKLQTRAIRTTLRYKNIRNPRENYYIYDLQQAIEVFRPFTYKELRTMYKKYCTMHNVDLEYESLFE